MLVIRQITKELVSLMKGIKHHCTFELNLYIGDWIRLNFISDIAQDSDQRKFHVRPGDLIILSSDGLYDVVEDEKIERIVRSREENVCEYNQIFYYNKIWSLTLIRVSN